MAKTEDWQAELWDLVRKLKEHTISLKEYNTEKRRLAAKAPDAAAFAQEEQRLFDTALDYEASANAIHARAEGPPYVVPPADLIPNDPEGRTVMNDLTQEQQHAIKASWDFIQRMAMTLVSTPREHRVEQYAIIRRHFQDNVKEYGFQEETAFQWVDLMVKALQERVSEIEAGGGAAGGHA
jgi:hypothetical protein